MERRIRILAGLISLVLFSSLVYFGVKVAVGALDPRYQLEASFTAAGQGLLSGSDVKIHGVNIGSVKSVRLVEGHARVRMDIEKGQRVPVQAKAIIRPKTLFGEKFVDIDPGDGETSGPFLADEGVIRDTLGGFELERILTDLYPVLQAVEPAELAVVLDVLAEGGRGLGATINRSIVNFSTLADVQADHDADLRVFLDALADLSEELAGRAGDVVGAARDLNVALPPLNQRSAELTTLLEQASRLSTDVADVLAANRGFQEKAITHGGRSLQILFDRRGQLPGLVTGLRQFFEVLASVGHIPYGDGTYLAAVKFIIGEDCPEGRLPPCPTASRPVQPRAGASRPLPAPKVGAAAVESLLAGGTR